MTSSKHLSLNNNRTLVEVSGLAPMRELYFACFPAVAKQTLEQFSSSCGYYLMTVPVQVGFQADIKENAIRKISNKIFIQELLELGVPETLWPDVDDFDVFSRFIKVEYRALVADFGDGPVENIKT